MAVGNYALSGGATVSAATLSADRFSVTLTTSKLTENTDYTLTVNNVQDNASNASNAIAANTQATFTSWSLVPNRAKVDIWYNISGTTVDTLTADSRFPATPDNSWYSTTGMTQGNPNGNSGWFDSFGANWRQLRDAHYGLAYTSSNLKL